MTNPNALLTVTQAAKRLGVSPNTVRAWADRGAIPVLRLPSGHRRFELSAIDALRRPVHDGSAPAGALRALSGPGLNAEEERSFAQERKQHGLSALADMERLAAVFEERHRAAIEQRGRPKGESPRDLINDDEKEAMGGDDAAFEEEMRQILDRERPDEEWAQIAANRKEMFAFADALADRHGGSFAVDSVTIIRNMREDRTQELMRTHQWE